MIFGLKRSIEVNKNSFVVVNFDWSFDVNTENTVPITII